jgi:sugar phosphate isomerase/epimerase
MRKLILSLVAAALMLPVGMQAAQNAKGKKQFAIQLYSIREVITGDKANFNKLLNDLSAMGYTAVESASYDQEKGLIYGLTPEEYKAAVEAAGMESLSAHIGKPLSDEELNSGDFSQSLSWWDKTIADQKKAGVSYIVMPWMGLPSSLSQLKVYCDYYNAIGKKCAAQGIKFGYHNHKHEFEKLEGQVAYDYMLQNTDPRYVFFQIDLYWCVRANMNPIDYFKKYPGRFKLFHVKDEYELGGSCSMGFDVIFKNAELAGLEYQVVEIERYSHPVMQEAKESADYINSSSFIKKSYKKK